jgi:hypothetical protein
VPSDAVDVEPEATNGASDGADEQRSQQSMWLICLPRYPSWNPTVRRAMTSARYRARLTGCCALSRIRGTARPGPSGQLPGRSCSND